MVERFFLDRVYTEAAGAPIGGEHDAVALAFTHKTYALLAIVQFAKTRAQVALQAAIIDFVPVTGRHDMGEGVTSVFMRYICFSLVKRFNWLYRYGMG